MFLAHFSDSRQNRVSETQSSIEVTAVPPQMTRLGSIIAHPVSNTTYEDMPKEAEKRSVARCCLIPSVP